MSGAELAALFRRDLARLAQELRAIPVDGVLWMKPPGVSNPIGNLVLHLEGNLREYIGRQLGGTEEVEPCSRAAGNLAASHTRASVHVNLPRPAYLWMTCARGWNRSRS